jgi:two-component system LytT family response regulator
MTRLRLVLADDEQIARKRLRRLLAPLEGIEIVAECTRGTEVIEAAQKGDVDILLLDIAMPGLTGLEAVGLLPEPRPYVIFCTAYAEHAVAAFEVGAVDYLLKPVEAGRLRVALERAKKWCEARLASPPPAPRLAIETSGGVVLLDPVEISHAELDGALVTIHAAGRKVLSDLPLQTLEARLPAGRFLRVHRRALLNLDHVALLEPTSSGGYIAKTRAGHAVEVSRQAARDLRRLLGLRRADVEHE